MGQLYYKLGLWCFSANQGQGSTVPQRVNGNGSFGTGSSGNSSSNSNGKGKGNGVRQQQRRAAKLDLRTGKLCSLGRVCQTGSGRQGSGRRVRGRKARLVTHSLTHLPAARLKQVLAGPSSAPVGPGIDVLVYT